MRADSEEGELPDRYPIRGIFPICCAAAEPQSAKSKAPRSKNGDFFLHVFFSVSIHLSLDILVPSHLMTLIRPIQHRLWNRQADCLGGFEVDHQLELRRLLDWQIGGLGSLEDLVHVGGCAPVAVG